jgi:hypothetical protein
MLRHFLDALLVVTLTALPQYITAQTPRVQTVTIKSAWGGLSFSRPEPVELVIRRQSDGFYLNDERVDTGVVEALVTALKLPPIPKPQASNLGITEEWLKENVDEAGAKRFLFTVRFDAYKKFFIDPAKIAELLPSLFAGFLTDDYPRVEVELLFDGGGRWSASSNSQHEFMIPWSVRAGKVAFTTFNADISRKVASLLPPKSVNRQRLLGEFLKFELAGAAMARMEEETLNSSLSLLRSQYNVDRSEITPDVSIHYGQDWKNGRPQQENALFVLRRDTFPQLFSSVFQV